MSECIALSVSVSLIYMYMLRPTLSSVWCIMLNNLDWPCARWCSSVASEVTVDMFHFSNNADILIDVWVVLLEAKA